eukprot:m.123716 g.123716  ORF g.123716 m.123716 type:complete len:435 (+) comp15685_c0_seq1:24-1328(+)
MMATITVQVGQAGNQVGEAILAELAANHKQPTTCFRSIKSGKTIARAIVVDTEPKVVAKLCQPSARSWAFAKNAVVCERRGAGNNWAHGYLSYGNTFADKVMECYRKEAEQADSLNCLQVCSSVAGGTGSGLGTRITEALRDEHSKTKLVNLLVWPFSSGEVIVQSYNAVLTLSHVHAASDALVMLSNDRAQQVCQHTLHLKSVAVDHLNQVFATNIATCLAPALPTRLDNCSKTFGRQTCSDVYDHVVPHPDYKLLTATSLPQMPSSHQAYSRYEWSALAGTARAMLLAHAPCQEGFNRRLKPQPAPLLGVDVNVEQPSRTNTCVASQLVLRGNSLHQASVTDWLDPGLYAAWSPSPFAVAASTHSQPHDKSLGLLYNAKRNVDPIDHAMDKAWCMYAKRAYVHQYQRRGLEEADFDAAFLATQQVICDYQSL